VQIIYKSVEAAHALTPQQLGALEYFPGGGPMKISRYMTEVILNFKLHWLVQCM
jgi:hypothetical protein